MSISPEQISQYFNIGLLVVFGLFVAAFVIGFIRGLFQGWKYGTLRLVVFASLVAAAIFTIKPLMNGIASFDLSGFGGPIAFSINSVAINVPLTTVQGTLTELISQILKSMSVSLDPAALTNYALAIALSVLSIVLLIVECVVIAILGNLLSLLLWHLIFKHLTPKDKRKKKTLRLVSGFESGIITFVVFTLFLSPLTGMLNTLNRSFERIAEEDKVTNSVVVDSDVYQIITGCLDTYDNSLLSKAFFSWYADKETGMRFDEAFLSYISTITMDDGQEFSIVSELGNVVKAASYAIDGGILGTNGFSNQSLALFATSQYAPKALRALGQSKLVQQVTPIALQVVMNFEVVADFLATEEGIDFYTYDYASTFDGLADIYESVVDSGVLDELVDSESKEFVMDTAHVSNMLDSSYQTVVDKVFDTLSSSEMKLLNDIICSVLYVQAVKEYEKGEAPGEVTIGAKDLFPELTEAERKTNSKGTPVAIPASIKNINFAEEFRIVVDSLFGLINVDDDLLPLILNPVLDSENYTFDEQTITDLLGIVLENADEVEKYIDGYSVTKAAPTTCLLDSKLIANAVPTFLRILQESTNDLLDLNGASAIDLSGIITDYKTKSETDKIASAKEETKAILGVVRPIVKSDEGKALIKDFENMPGLYFDKDGNFLGAKEELLEALAKGIENLDDSKVFSKMLPAVFDNFLTGEDGVLKQMLGVDLKLDFAPKNSSGESVLGQELAKIIRTYSSNQEVISYLSSALNGGGDIKALEQTFSDICKLKGSDGAPQLANLLIAIGKNQIFNPATGGEYNKNLYELFKMVFDTMGFNDASLQNDLKDVIMDINLDIDQEMNAFVDLLEYLCNEKLLGSLSDLSLDNMAKISFANMFAPVANSKILSTLISNVIDNNLTEVPLFSYVDEAGVTVKLSFKNISDWIAEGDALDKMMKYASVVGDISSISLDSIDPEMINSLFGYFANSSVFIRTNNDGTNDWLFPEYLASKVVKILKGSGDMGKYFTDVEETYTSADGYKVIAKDPSLDASYIAIKTDILSHGVYSATDMTLIENEQAVFEHEGEVLAEIIRSLILSGALDMMDNGDSAVLSDLNVAYFRNLMEKMPSSILMGRTGLSQILLTVVDMLKGSSESFANTNVYLAFSTNDINVRTRISNALASIIEVAVDPVSGLLGTDGKIDSTKFDHVESLDADHFLVPLLRALNSTEVFTTLSTYQENTALITETAFLGQMGMVLRTTNWYGSNARANALLPIIDANVKANGGWDDEIARFGQVLKDFQFMGADITGDLSFDGMFADEAYGEDVVSKLLIDINESHLLYPGFPEQLDKAIDTLQTGSLATSGIDLGNANTYYKGKAMAGTYSYATAGFDEDECYTLASIISSSSGLDTIDINDISTLNTSAIEDVTDLLASIAQSNVFNTLKSGTSSSVFQDIMGSILGGDSMKDYYISNVSPKDAANVSNYTTAIEKAKYIANLEYPYISSTNSNSDVSNINGTDPSSFRSFLLAVTADSDLVSALSSGDLDTLSESKMTTLLNALNKCDWTYDIVPNSIADAIVGQTIDSVEIKRANAFYAYDYNITLNGTSYENDGTTLLTSDYSNRYDDDELELVAKIVSIINNDPDLVNGLTTKPKFLNLKNFLDVMNDSYSFHLAGASYDLLADDSLDFTSKDLSVFEQVMYSLYDKSGLASMSYSAVYDAEYTSYTAKLLDIVNNYPDSKWGTEIENLIINSTMDKGLFSVALDQGLIDSDGVSMSSSDLSGKNPTDLSEILYAVNKVDLVCDLVAYELQKTMLDDLKFQTFSSASPTYTVNASSYELDISSVVFELKIEVFGGSAPTVSYKKAGATINVVPTGSNPYTYDLSSDRPLGKNLTISASGTIVEITPTIATDAEVGLTQAQFDTDTEVGGVVTHKGAIKELISIANDCFYDPITGNYVDFNSNPNALNTLFTTSGNVSKIFGFVQNEDSFFRTKYDSSFKENEAGTFSAADVTTAGLLSFKVGAQQANLFTYMPDYDSSNLVPGYLNIHSLFAGKDAATVTAWLDGNILKAGGFYGAYSILPNTAQKALVVPSMAYEGLTISDYLVTSADYNTFEAIFKTGFCRNLYHDFRIEASLGPWSNLSVNEYKPSASDYDDFITLTKDKLLPLLSKVKKTGITDQNGAGTIFNELATLSSSPCRDVIVAYYEDQIIEALRLWNSAAFADEDTNYPNAFGASGYLRHAAITLNPSLI